MFPDLPLLKIVVPTRLFLIMFKNTPSERRETKRGNDIRLGYSRSTPARQCAKKHPVLSRDRLATLRHVPDRQTEETEGGWTSTARCPVGVHPLPASTTCQHTTPIHREASPRTLPQSHFTRSLSSHAFTPSYPIRHKQSQTKRHSTVAVTYSSSSPPTG